MQTVIAITKSLFVWLKLFSCPKYTRHVVDPWRSWSVSVSVTVPPLRNSPFGLEPTRLSTDFRVCANQICNVTTGSSRWGSESEHLKSVREQTSSLEANQSVRNCTIPAVKSDRERGQSDNDTDTEILRPSKNKKGKTDATWGELSPKPVDYRSASVGNSGRESAPLGALACHGIGGRKAIITILLVRFADPRRRPRPTTVKSDFCRRVVARPKPIRYGFGSEIRAAVKRQRASERRALGG